MLKERGPWIHLVLFILTLGTTTIAGAEWMYGRFLFFGDQTITYDNFLSGLNFSIPFILILTFHEFGHYFVARWHGIKVTLPFYIPLWFGFIAMPSFGTMGAFIRIKETIFSRKEYFDVGVAGPLAGFVIALFCIYYGFTNLPPQEYIFEIHPEYEAYGLAYADYVYNDQNGISFRFGDNIIYWFFQNYVVEDASLLPHPNEIIHYPYLLAGYLALFFTALNLLPIGQLDGGHVTFGLFGWKISRRLNEVFYTLFLFYAGLGLITPAIMADISIMGGLQFLLTLLLYLYFLFLCVASMIPRIQDRMMFAAIMLTTQFIINYFTGWEGYTGWLLFAFIIGRFLGVYHPRVADNRPLDTGRKIIGWIAIVVFILSFSPKPFVVG
jgi:membrane-associated protease RseP (regulator of RpoE activity)